MKKTLRQMSWEDYGISKQRYKELKAFCRQYGEKKDRIKYGLTAVVQDGMPHGNSVGNPTERQAMENAQYNKDVVMIEEAATKACPQIAAYILRSVTEGLPYEKVMYDAAHGQIPVCEADFYAYRRLFYYYLHLSKFDSN